MASIMIEKFPHRIGFRSTYDNDMYLIESMVDSFKYKQ